MNPSIDTKEFLCELFLSLDLKDKWTEQVIHAIANITNGWSMRATFLNAPDETGRVVAKLQFLSPDAPIIPEEFELLRGKTVVARCKILDSKT